MKNRQAPVLGPDAGPARVGPLLQTPSPLPVALIVDSHEWSARSLESILAPGGFAVERVGSGRQAAEQAARTPPDLIFIDAELPDTSGIALCRRLRGESHIGEVTPILLMLAAPVAREQRLAALRAGAWELVALPLDAEELLLKLGNLVRAKLAADSARAESLLDGPSGLYNVRGLLRRAREMGAETRRNRRALGCAVFALTGEATEHGGVEAADRVGRLLQGGVRGCDAVGRLSNHEFVVLAPETNKEGMLRLVERLTSATQGCHAPRTDGFAPHGLRAGCFAVADFADAGIEPVELLVRAAKALRSLRGSDDGERIRFYDHPVPVAAGASDPPGEFPGPIEQRGDGVRRAPFQ